jgi:hypothetical protein
MPAPNSAAHGPSTSALPPPPPLRPASGGLLGALNRERALDWAVVVAGAILLGATNSWRPETPYLLKALLSDVAKPLLPNSVPAWSVPLIALALPLAALAALHAAARRVGAPSRVEDLHRAALGLVAGVVVTGCVTNILKVGGGHRSCRRSVGRASRSGGQSLCRRAWRP